MKRIHVFDLKDITDGGNSMVFQPSNGVSSSSAGNNDEVQTTLIFQSVIQHLCSFYEHDPDLRHRLFVAICSSLVRMKLLAPNVDSNAFQSQRSQFSTAFERLIKVAQKTVRGSSPDTLDGAKGVLGAQSVLPIGFSHPLAVPSSGLVYHHSRYANEFEEQEFLARGGFGSVYKARNRLDNVSYAVKKIVLKHRRPQQFTKILREVTTLARLTNCNIVAYKTAWLEPFVSKSKHAGQDEEDDSSNESSFSTTNNNPLKSSSFTVDFEPEGDSIVFEESRDESIVFEQESSVTKQQSSIWASPPNKGKGFLCHQTEKGCNQY